MITCAVLADTGDKKYFYSGVKDPDKPHNVNALLRSFSPDFQGAVSFLGDKMYDITIEGESYGFNYVMAMGEVYDIPVVDPLYIGSYDMRIIKPFGASERGENILVTPLHYEDI